MLWWNTEHLQNPNDRIVSVSGSSPSSPSPSPSPKPPTPTSFARNSPSGGCTPDTYLLHEHLEQFNEPSTSTSSSPMLPKTENQSLGEAQLSAMIPSRFGPDAGETIRAPLPRPPPHGAVHGLPTQPHVPPIPPSATTTFPSTTPTPPRTPLKNSTSPPAKPQSENPILHDDTPETFSTTASTPNSPPATPS